MESHETIRIPALDLSVSQRFPLFQVPVQVGEQIVLIDVVYQDIRLRLDETGADFASVAEIVIGEFGETEPEYNPERTRKLVFDEPFFVALIEPNAHEPYFMGWIGNAELMEPSAESRR